MSNPETPPPLPNRRYGFGLVALACAASLPAILWRSLLAQVSGLQSLSASSPYFQGVHAGLLYGAMPLVAASSFVFFLAPGICLVSAAGKVRNLLERILLSFGASLALSIILQTCLKLGFGPALSDDLFVDSWLLTLICAAAFCSLRIYRGLTFIPPLIGSERRRLAWMGAVSLAAVAILTPKLFWENFNIDGTEAFEFGRSLGSHVLPFWDIQGGVFGFYHNFVLFAYPNHWFIAMFGPFEGSVRLTFVLYLIVLFAVLVLLIEHGFDRGLRFPEEAALWLGLAVFTILQVYNTTYDPFFVDIAEPGATDCLMVVCFLSAVYFMWTERMRSFVFFTVVTFLSTVGGLALLVALGLSLLTLPQARKWTCLKYLVATGFCCVALGIVHETLYNALVLKGAKDQFSTRNMAARLFPPTLTEFYRLGAVLFPSGLLPALSILTVSRADQIAWTTGLITIFYSGVIYAQAWTALHQFTPAMVLPLIVFWRIYLKVRTRLQPWLLGSVVLTTAVCLVLSLPRHFEINVASRNFGAATEFRVGDYAQNYQTSVHAAASVLGFLLPADYRLKYPNQSWGMDDSAWVYYAFHKPSPAPKVNYLVQKDSDRPPEGATLAGSKGGFAVYVRDTDLWARDRALQLPQVVQSPLYEPILRRTCAFYRAYMLSQQQKTSAHQ